MALTTNAEIAATQTEATPLVRELGTLDAAMIVVGSMIGSGIFITSAASARYVGAPGWLLVAWGLAGLMTITGSLCAAEIAAMMPRAGGQYVFLREAYSPMFGFLFGWAMFLVVQTGTIAAVAVAFAKFLAVFFSDIASNRYVVEPLQIGGGYAVSLSTQQLAALLLIALLTLVNTRGLRLGKWIQNTFTFTKTAALIGLIAVGLLLGGNFQSAAWTSWWWDSTANGWDPHGLLKDRPLEGTGGLLLLLGLAMIGPLFSQSAWNNVTFTGGEVRDPGRTLPRALILGVSGVVVLYLLANLAYIVTLDFATIKHAPQDRVGTALMEAVLGPSGGKLMAAAILISTFGCVNGLVLAGARVYYAMAKDGLFFTAIAKTNRHHVPAAALLAQGFWACLLVLPMTVSAQPDGTIKYGNVYNELLEYVIPVDVLFYTLLVGAVVSLRWKAPQLPRPYRTILYPLPVITYMTLAVLLVLDFIYLNPLTSRKGFLIVLAGIPVYLAWSRMAARSVEPRAVSPAPQS
jgi:APA family basic amino acid/polyamine antiporter